jgi:hypothetical protein
VNGLEGASSSTGPSASAAAYKFISISTIYSNISGNQHRFSLRASSNGNFTFSNSRLIIVMVPSECSDDYSYYNASVATSTTFSTPTLLFSSNVTTQDWTDLMIYAEISSVQSMTANTGLVFQVTVDGKPIATDTIQEYGLTSSHAVALRALRQGLSFGSHTISVLASTDGVAGQILQGASVRMTVVASPQKPTKLKSVVPPYGSPQGGTIVTVQVEDAIFEATDSIQCRFTRATSCADLYARGYTTSGVYQIAPDGKGPYVSVYCDQSTLGGGWTMLYTSDGSSIVSISTESSSSTPYGTNGYRADARYNSKFVFSNLF